ncbi:MAG TPA: VTT domain-containing protein [Candidatus Saccharimonadales bacterium]
MIPGFELSEFAQSAGPWAAVLVLMAIIFAESGLLIGFFLPGDSILFTAGFLVHAGILNFDIHLLVFLLFIAAVAGDSVGYLFGRRVGRRIFNRPNSRLFRQENIQKAEEFYDKHGSKTIILARFIPVVRTFAPIVAGVGKMEYKNFILFNVIGALLWAVGITYAGYYIGAALESVGIHVDTILLPIIAFIVLISILPPAIHILKDKERRDVMWEGTKRQIKTLFRKK